MTAEEREPERAGGTARYGLKWHAKDRAQAARFWAARASLYELMSVIWMAGGPLLFAAALGTGSLDAGVWVPATAMFLAGAALFAVARLRGWHR